MYILAQQRPFKFNLSLLVTYTKFKTKCFFVVVIQSFRLFKVFDDGGVFEAGGDNVGILLSRGLKL